MAKSKLSSHTLTDAEYRSLVNVFQDPLLTAGFVRLLEETKVDLLREQYKSAQAFLMNNSEPTRVVALLRKGEVEFIDHLLNLISTVNK